MGRGARRQEERFGASPFEALKDLRDKLPDAGDDRTPEETPSPPRLREPRSASRAEREASLLEQALADVRPLEGRGRVPKRQGRLEPRPAGEDRAVQVYLRDLVDGAVPFDIADTDEYVEGAVQGLDRRVLRQLRRGEFSVQDHIDLHGMNREEARDAVARFLRSAVSRGQRCVLVVHGRGLHAKDQIPVLKEKLKAWLTRGAIGASVLAFATARPYDGGAGAVYVLLRR
jgi:DNA-nicking Smr family endonuclease